MQRASRRQGVRTWVEISFRPANDRAILRTREKSAHPTQIFSKVLREAIPTTTGQSR